MSKSIATRWFETLNPATYRKFAKRRDLDVLSDDPDDPEDDDDEDDLSDEEEENRDSDLEQSIKAVVTAAPSISRQQAATWILNSAHGRALHNALHKKETKMTEKINIYKLHNVESVVEVAKNLEVGSETEFTKILDGHARSTGSTLEKTLMAPTPEAAELRTQYARIRNLPFEMRR